MELGVDVETHTITAAERAAESIGPPVAINRDNLTMAVVTGLAAGQSSSGVRITRPARRNACSNAQISGDREQTGTTGAAEPGTDIDAS